MTDKIENNDIPSDEAQDDASASQTKPLVLQPGEVARLPMLPLRDVVVFPQMVIPLFVGRPKSIKALEHAMEADKAVVLLAQKSAADDDPGPDALYDVGCVASILKLLKLPDGTVKVLVEGAQRAHIHAIHEEATHFSCELTPVAAEATA